MSGVLSGLAFATPSLPVVDVEVPELGGAVRLRMLTAAQREDYGLAIAACDARHAEAPEGVRSLERVRALRRELLMRSVVDADGKPVFDPESIDALFAQPPAIVDRLFVAAVDLNRIGKDAGEEAKNA